jgi:hypothetical protein
MWLTVTAHLELYHSTVQLELRQDVFIELPEIKTRMFEQLHHQVWLCHTGHGVFRPTGVNTFTALSLDLVSYLLGQSFST